jgi:hypothetical protein
VLNFFDYLYYCTRTFYSENKERGSGVSALAVVALMQTLNISSIYFLYCLISETRVNVSKSIIVGLYFCFIVLNGVRYSKLDPDIIKEKWEKEKDNHKIRLRTFLLIYVVLSITLSFGLAIYLGSRKS